MQSLIRSETEEEKIGKGYKVDCDNDEYYYLRHENESYGVECASKLKGQTLSRIVYSAENSKSIKELRRILEVMKTIGEKNKIEEHNIVVEKTIKHFNEMLNTILEKYENTYEKHSVKNRIELNKQLQGIFSFKIILEMKGKLFSDYIIINSFSPSDLEINTDASLSDFENSSINKSDEEAQKNFK